MKKFVFIDAEYCYTSALHEGMIPDYKAIIEIFRNKENKDSVVIFAYFAGNKEKKQGVANFLINSGVDFVNIIDLVFCRKTQVLGSTIALDVCRVYYESNKDSEFCFLSGDDYLLPIIEFLSKADVVPNIHYFPVILSRGLSKRNCKLIRLSDKYFMFMREAERGNERSNPKSQKA